MYGYAKLMKDLVTKKRVINFEIIEVTQNCSVVMTSNVVVKKDLGAFTILCTIGKYKFGKALCDVGDGINLMPLSMFGKLGLGDPMPTLMRLFMVDCSIKELVGYTYKG